MNKFAIAAPARRTQPVCAAKETTGMTGIPSIHVRRAIDKTIEPVKPVYAHHTMAKSL